MTGVTIALIPIWLFGIIATSGCSLDVRPTVDSPELAETDTQVPERTLFDFSDPKAAKGWRTVNDTVMGGRSVSSFMHEDANGVFEGRLSLENYGGFATARCDWGYFELAGFDGLEFMVRGDGRRYKVFIKTNAGDDGYQYQADLQTEQGQWKVVRIPFSDFDPYYRGTKLWVWKSLGRDFRSLGVMLADKQDGEFKLEVRWIKAYTG